MRREVVKELEAQRAKPRRWIQSTIDECSAKVPKFLHASKTEGRSEGDGAIRSGQLTVLVRNLSQLEAALAHLRGRSESLARDFADAGIPLPVARGKRRRNGPDVAVAGGDIEPGGGAGSPTAFTGEAQAIIGTNEVSNAGGS